MFEEVEIEYWDQWITGQPVQMVVLYEVTKGAHVFHRTFIMFPIEGVPLYSAN